LVRILGSAMGLGNGKEGQSGRSRLFLVMWGFATAVSLLLHFPSFSRTHDEPDEQVYMGLAREMNWDLSRYTTMHVPRFRQLPYSIYRQPLFHQPPLYPLVLKVGQSLGIPVVTGLVFNNLAMALLLYFAWRWSVVASIPPGWAVAAFAGLTLCPLLLTSTSLLHLDGLLGTFGAGAVVAYIDALERPAGGRAVLAGVLFAAALNLRYNALILLPTIPLLQAFHLHRRSAADGHGGEIGRVASNWRNWQMFTIVATAAVTLGIPHYLRIFATYGTLWPSEFITPAPDIGDFSPYLRSVVQRTPWWMAGRLILTFPFLLVFLTSLPYAITARGLKEGSWGPVMIAIFMYAFAVEFCFSYQQMRFFAAEMPFLYLGVPHLLCHSPGRLRVALLGVGGLTLLLMAVAGFARTVVLDPGNPEVRPALLIYLPWLEVRFFRIGA
jgi:hypothetical protein